MAIQIVIVEDEPVTARNLVYLLNNIDKDISIVATLNSVTEAVAWFRDNPHVYDLVFMDIRLADGLSFDIFKAVAIDCSVIFATAYNEYALQAFKNNGIDYILKPFDEQEIAAALNKFKNLITQQVRTTTDTNRIQQLIQQIAELVKPHKKSFLVHFRDKLIPVETAKIAWFYTANEIVYGHTGDGKQYIMDFTMEYLELQIDPQVFFRANRQFIVNRNFITEVDFYFNGRLLLKVKPEPTERILISKARVPEFKSWMNR